MEKLRERHGCDFVVKTQNDGLRVLVGRKCLLAVLRPVHQSLFSRHDAIIDDYRLLPWHLGGHREVMGRENSSCAFRALGKIGPKFHFARNALRKRVTGG
eukprot:1533681-Rhodomonas_salina.1